MSTPDPTPTPLPAAPDWRALCQELHDALDSVFQVMAGEAGTDHINTATNVLLRADVALDTPPAPSLEPRGCPTPGACSCPAAPIVPPELLRALELAETALSDIGDAEREPGDDIAWAERRAAQDLPRIRHALRTWRDHATPPTATRKAEHDDGDDAIDRWVDSKSDWIANWGAPRSDIAALIGEALEHWGRSATREAGPPVAFIHRQGDHWEVSERSLDEQEKACGWTQEPLYSAPTALPVPAAAAGEVQP